MPRTLNGFIASTDPDANAADAAVNLAIAWLAIAREQPRDIIATAATIVIATDVAHMAPCDRERYLAVYLEQVRRSVAAMRLAPPRAE